MSKTSVAALKKKCPDPPKDELGQILAQILEHNPNACGLCLWGADEKHAKQTKSWREGWHGYNDVENGWKFWICRNCYNKEWKRFLRDTPIADVLDNDYLRDNERDKVYVDLGGEQFIDHVVREFRHQFRRNPPAPHPPYYAGISACPGAQGPGAGDCLDTDMFFDDGDI